MANILVVIAGLSIAWASSFRSNPLKDCQSHLDSKSIRRLERAIARLLPAGNGPLTGERKRLHRLMTAYVAGMIGPLDKARTEHFFDVVEHGGVIRHAVSQRGQSVALGEDDVHLGFDDTLGLYLHLGSKFSNSLLGYLRLLHEMSHLSRAVSGDATIEEQFEHYNARILRWRGVYREEVAAARDEYRFLRWAYPAEQLAKIERRSIAPRTNRQVESGTSAINQTFGNEEYLRNVRRALTLPMREYVRHAVPLSEYRDQQIHFARERWRTRYVSRTRQISPWLAKHLDRLTAYALYLLERPPLMTKDSSSR